MKFYATTYNYHGLKRSDVRRVWEEVFMHYENISSSHVFTELELVRADGVRKAYVTCTGWLDGTEKQTGKPITIDSWVREAHYLVKEEGRWRSPSPSFLRLEDGEEWIGHPDACKPQGKAPSGSGGNEKLWNGRRCFR
jgi:hypothetical protein